MKQVNPSVSSSFPFLLPLPETTQSSQFPLLMTEWVAQAWVALQTLDGVRFRGLLPWLGIELLRERYGQSPQGRALRRAMQIAPYSSLDTGDLRSWYYIHTGGLLTHVAPPMSAGQPTGCYHRTQDTTARCREGIVRLQAVLTALDVQPALIFGLPDLHSTTLAQAAARLLQVPWLPWPQEGTEEPGLIIAYDLQNVEGAFLTPLRSQHPGQLLFAQATSWSASHTLTPDITTYLYRANTPPWGGEALGSSSIERHIQALVDSPISSDQLPDLAEWIDWVQRLSQDPLDPPSSRREKEREKSFAFLAAESG